MIDREGAVPCTSCGAAIYKDWTRVFKQDSGGTMQAYHLRCAAPPDACPSCDEELPEGVTGCYDCGYEPDQWYDEYVYSIPRPK